MQSSSHHGLSHYLDPWDSSAAIYTEQDFDDYDTARVLRREGCSKQGNAVSQSNSFDCYCSSFLR
jgi:hypothetical protein